MSTTPPSGNATGRQFGSYELVELLGQGGMGEVWRATHIKLGRPAAVKLIRAERLDGVGEEGLTALRRFEREAQATSRLTSPHTIEVYDFGTADDGTFYYAMELLDGLDLKSLVESDGPVPAERAVYLLRQACESLEEAHLRGLVHRDVKPANLFACRLGLRVDVVKVLDFGLVKFSPDSAIDASQLTTDGVAPGSPAYIAPELAVGAGRIDARCDIYSLGCVGYWLLTGQLVFTADTPLGIVLAHIDKVPDPPSKRVELPVPPDLEALVLDCLQKKPADRPASMHEVLERLDAVELPEPWSQQRAHRWWRRHHPARPGQAIAPVRGSSGVAEASESPAPERSGAKPGPEPRVTEVEPAEPKVSPSELSEERERTLHVLQDAFAHSRLDVNELSRRTELVQYAASPRQLDALVADLDERPPEGALVPSPDELPAPAREGVETGGALVPARRPKQTLISFMSGISRKGRWTPAGRVRSFNFLGGTELDFRQAQLPPGRTDIRCYAFMGGVDITVPPDLYVEVNGIAFLGGFEQSGHSLAPPPSADEPWLRIGGFVIMGGVDVKVKDLPKPGEGFLESLKHRFFGRHRRPRQLESDAASEGDRRRADPRDDEQT